MYKIGIPGTIRLIIRIFCRLRWCSRSSAENSFFDYATRMFYFLYYASFTASMGVGGYLTDDTDESVFLIVLSLLALVLLCKMWHIFRKNNLIVTMVHEMGTHYTNDKESFHLVKENLNFLMKFAQYFMMNICLAFFLLLIVFPVLNQRKKVLYINVAFPLDKTDEIYFWIANVYLGGGMFCATITSLFTIILWYIMFNFVIDYKLLGSHLKNMGSFRGKVVTDVQQQEREELYLKEVLSAVSTYDTING